MTVFRFLQISDLHLCIEPSRRNALSLFSRRPRKSIDVLLKSFSQRIDMTLYTPESYDPTIVNAAAAYTWQVGNHLDAIFFSGDIATTGMQTDLAAASNRVTKPARNYIYHENGPTFNNSNTPIFLLAGNHDNYRNDKGDPGGQAGFLLNFGDFMPNYRNGISHVVMEKDGHFISMIMADFSFRSSDDAGSAVARKYTKYGQGLVYADILRDLEHRTLTLRRRYTGIHVCWMVHFAPFDCGHHLKLIDFNKLISSAIPLNIQQIFCGHTHEPSTHNRGSVSIFCAGSAGAVGSEDNAQLHILEFDFSTANPSFFRRDIRFNAAQRSFS